MRNITLRQLEYAILKQEKKEKEEKILRLSNISSNIFLH